MMLGGTTITVQPRWLEAKNSLFRVLRSETIK